MSYSAPPAAQRVLPARGPPPVIHYDAALDFISRDHLIMYATHTYAIRLVGTGAPPSCCVVITIVTMMSLSCRQFPSATFHRRKHSSQLHFICQNLSAPRTRVIYSILNYIFISFFISITVAPICISSAALPREMKPSL